MVKSYLKWEDFTTDKFSEYNEKQKNNKNFLLLLFKYGKKYTNPLRLKTTIFPLIDFPFKYSKNFLQDTDNYNYITIDPNSMQFAPILEILKSYYQLVKKIMSEKFPDPVSLYNNEYAGNNNNKGNIKLKFLKSGKTEIYHYLKNGTVDKFYNTDLKKLSRAIKKGKEIRCVLSFYTWFSNKLFGTELYILALECKDADIPFNSVLDIKEIENRKEITNLFI